MCASLISSATELSNILLGTPSSPPVDTPRNPLNVPVVEKYGWNDPYTEVVIDYGTNWGLAKELVDALGIKATQEDVLHVLSGKPLDLILETETEQDIFYGYVRQRAQQGDMKAQDGVIVPGITLPKVVGVLYIKTSGKGIYRFELDGVAQGYGVRRLERLFGLEENGLFKFTEGDKTCQFTIERDNSPRLESFQRHGREELAWEPALDWAMNRALQGKPLTRMYEIFTATLGFGTKADLTLKTYEVGWNFF